MFRGERKTFLEISEMTGWTRGAIRARWEKEGRGPEIDEAFMDRLAANSKVTTIDGAVTTYEVLRKLFRVSMATISAMVKKHGRKLETSMFTDAKIALRKGKKIEKPKFVGGSTPKERELLAKIPGPGTWEREQMKNDDPKFFNGSSRASFSGYRGDGTAVYNGRQ
jgi:hypothetical protein